MTITSKSNRLLSHLKPFFSLQRLNHSLGGEAWFYSGGSSESDMEQQVQIDKSKWRKLDSRTLGITRNMIPESSWIVLKVLQAAGYEAYLVGGCVRDLILKKVPKDFDVITTAALKQIKKEFRRCVIVGTRFPICRVHLKGSVIEVSSFDTVAQLDREREPESKMPQGCDRKDFVRWRNSMQRDFTVNSLFFDPFVTKIYDYANGMMDLRFLKLRTLIPAELSFEEDRARILRGLRLAARLGLTLSRETESALRRHVSSIASLPKSRIMLELNYMLSFGASGSSLSLLQRFNLLEILLPVHAAHLSQQARSKQSSAMLMKLFFNLDKLFTCDRPSDPTLWVCLLAFHLALVKDPQNALVVWTFASILYHGNWKEGVKVGREYSYRPIVFIPEITEACHLMSDDELAEGVTQLASAFQYCITGLSEPDSLLDLMSRFPDSPCSGVVFIPKTVERRTSRIFNGLAQDAKSYMNKRGESFDINYKLLRAGDPYETRFVFGKILMDTMSSGPVEVSADAEKKHESDFENKIEVYGNEEKKRSLPTSDAQPQKSVKKKKALEKSVNFENGIICKQNKVGYTESDKAAKLKLEIIEKNREEIRSILHIFKEEKNSTVENEKQEEGSDESRAVVHALVNLDEKSHLPMEGINKRENVSENSEHFKDTNKKSEKNGKERKHKRVSLSSLFR